MRWWGGTPENQGTLHKKHASKKVAEKKMLKTKEEMRSKCKHKEQGEVLLALTRAGFKGKCGIHGEGNGTHSSTPAWRIPGTGEPARLPSMGLHRIGHD